MNYKPDEAALIAYLYGELSDDERAKVEQYLAETPDARIEMEKLRQLRKAMGALGDKEVIAPPIFIDTKRPRVSWNSPYIKTIISIAASLLLLMMVGWLTNARIGVKDSEVTISFGKEPAKDLVQPVPEVKEATLTPEQVQQMIDASLNQNNQAMQVSWEETHQKLNASIRQHLVNNSSKIDNLIKTASTASQEQIRDYVASMQTQNLQMVKDYFQLTSSEQKQYIEDLMVDFAKYLQQQRSDDLMLMQTKLNSIEQNTTQFKEETEQILSSIISNTNSNPGVTTIKY